MNGLLDCLKQSTLPWFPHPPTDPDSLSRQDLGLLWDYDPHVKTHGCRHNDYVAYTCLDHEDILSPDQWDEIVKNGTRNSFSSELRRKHLDGYIASRFLTKLQSGI